ncbi:MAG TPA: hypothetical protein VGW75_17630 [Solirubrobacteraceae bacterium]|jgi:hypothetical protein|nr:hypothetical protein [Solirubrobacteraceae bacterium]
MTAARRRELLASLADRSTSPNGLDRAELRRVLAARHGQPSIDG